MILRRSFLLGLGASLITAPAVVRATSIMPVRVVPGLGYDYWSRDAVMDRMFWHQQMAYLERMRQFQEYPDTEYSS